jgi:hypothetical protein
MAPTATQYPGAMLESFESPRQLRFEIARGGLVLVERQPYAWADFCAKAMIEWWDWAPTARLIHRAAANRSRGEHGSA